MLKTYLKPIVVSVLGVFLSGCYAQQVETREYTPREVIASIHKFFPEVRDPYISIEYGYYNAQKPTRMLINQVFFFLPTHVVQTQSWQTLQKQGHELMQALGRTDESECLHFKINHYDSQFAHTPEKMREVRIWFSCG